MIWAICNASSIWSSQNQTIKIRVSSVSTQTPLCQTALYNSITILKDVKDDVKDVALVQTFPTISLLIFVSSVRKTFAVIVKVAMEFSD